MAGMKASLASAPRMGCFQVVEVPLKRDLPSVGDGAGARHARGPGGSARELRVVLRKGQGLPRSRPGASETALERLEATEALVNIEDETRLAEFSVRDDVDAVLHLLAYHVGDRVAQPFGVRPSSVASPRWRRWTISSRSGGRGRLPIWVTRIRSVLRFMFGRFFSPDRLSGPLVRTSTKVASWARVRDPQPSPLGPSRNTSPSYPRGAPSRSGPFSRLSRLSWGRGRRPRRRTRRRAPPGTRRRCRRPSHRRARRGRRRGRRRPAPRVTRPASAGPSAPPRPR